MSCNNWSHEVWTKLPLSTQWWSMKGGMAPLIPNFALGVAVSFKSRTFIPEGSGFRVTTFRVRLGHRAFCDVLRKYEVSSICRETNYCSSNVRSVMHSLYWLSYPAATINMFLSDSVHVCVSTSRHNDHRERIFASLAVGCVRVCVCMSSADW